MEDYGGMSATTDDILAEQRRTNELLNEILVELIAINESTRARAEAEVGGAAQPREKERAKCLKCHSVYMRPKGADDGNECGQC